MRASVPPLRERHRGVRNEGLRHGVDPGRQRDALAPDDRSSVGACFGPRPLSLDLVASRGVAPDTLRRQILGWAEQGGGV
jgi:hypothetical protein